MKKFALFALAALLIMPLSASAHSTVSPASVPPASYQTFTLSVPTEKEIPTVGIRLTVPAGLERITPFVKPGWRIETKVDEATGQVSEITWSGGTIPDGRKDVFQFTARTPEGSTELAWKAYQSYSDGTIVAWDQAPHTGGHGDGEEVKNPYSVTKVEEPAAQKETADAPLALSLLACAVSCIALFVAMRKTKA